LAADAFLKVSFLDDPVCDGCGIPFEFNQGIGALCPACMARPRAFSRARAACLYDEGSRDLISDWRAPLSCGNFNVKTGKCGGKM
jgi:predicted amidophosphoribosyltransferase